MTSQIKEKPDIPMPYHIYKQLKEYLEGREYDIAINWEDFSELEQVFIWACMRSPSDKTVVPQER